MNVKEAYDNWSQQYDSNKNRTRDLEALALRRALGKYQFDNCLEIGCGTGKNTEWLITKAKNITAVDLSQEMMAKAKEKIKSTNVNFIQADILEDWNFINSKYDLVSFSLVLEHIENLEFIFEKISKVVTAGGLLYVGELHPFKQYAGTKARYSTAEGEQIVTCFNHHITDFISAAKRNRFEIIDMQEYFDDDDKTNIPRIISFVFRTV